MQKKQMGTLATLLVAGVGCVSGTAQAQSVQLYGVVDKYIAAISSSGHTSYGMDSGGMQISRWGMRGSESLGNGLKVNFTLETGFNSNNGTPSNATTSFGRQSWIGMSHEKYGEFRVGLQNSIFFNMLGNISAFYGGSFGAGLSTKSGYNFRNSNDFMIASPRLSGWRAEAHHSFGEDSANSKNGTTNQLAIDYRGGKSYFLAGYVEARPLVSSPNVYKGVVNRQYALGGSYDIDKFRIYLGYFKNKQSDNLIDKDLYSISAAWFVTPKDQLSIGYTYIKANADAANTDKTFTGNGHSNHFGLLYMHMLSKRTTLYFSGAHITNSSGMRYAMAAAQAPQASLLNRPAAGDSTTGVQFGIRHTF